MTPAESIKHFVKRLVYLVWVLHGFVGRRSKLDVDQAVTVLITYYNPARLRHVNHQIRNLLKCEFVERIVISNHNPQFKIDDFVKVHDRRLVLRNQSTRRGCGYRWLVARDFSPEYLIVVDDDIVLFPRQLKVLFESLLREPAIPHGLSGMRRKQDGHLEFRQRENIEVHYLTEIYAVSQEHLERYFEMVEILEEQDENISDEIGSMVDFIVISQTGTHQPKIHKAGRIYRDETFNVEGVAVHKNERFSIVVNKVSQAVERLRTR